MQTRLITTLFTLILPFVLQAQDGREMRDSLNAARIISDRAVTRDAGTRIVELPTLRTIVSATGEADAVKYIQTLPGVSTGAEGSSAFYVRGGNLGSNLTTIDGVPLYGGSHLLGLTGAYPTEIMSSMVFRLGGFHGDEGNLTSSHIDLRTADGDFTQRKEAFSVSNFLLGGSVSMPLVEDEVSLLASVRISPLGPEFSAARTLAGGALDSLSRTRALAYDAFAKVKWLVDADNTFSFSLFNSLDAYSYCYGGYSDEKMGWGNLVINARHEGRLEGGWTMEDGLSYNRFSNHQGVIRDMSGTVNNLAIVSSLDELAAEAVFIKGISRDAKLRLGARERLAWFNPGTSSTFKGEGPLMTLDSPRSDHVSHSSITSLHAQYDVQVWKWFSMMAAARLDTHLADRAGSSRVKFNVNPGLSLMARMDLTSNVALEATADWTTQYYHTLEGIPVGWSADLLVPTSPSVPPEHARQYYAGIFTSFGQHHLTLGAYDKAMSNLVYFLDAGQLFSPVIAGWSNNIRVGSGTSRGVEFLYEKDGERLDWHLAYTLSKTDRLFDKVNNGQRFLAKFDRRHVLNTTLSYKVIDDSRKSIALTGLYTWQSGHWETVAAGEYPAQSITGETTTLDYFTTVNNYEMPAYIRLDFGCSMTLRTRHEQTLNIGVYNVMNRHNPLSIIYDDRTRTWKQVSLLPIMPNFSYRVVF